MQDLTTFLSQMAEQAKKTAKDQGIDIVFW